MFPLVALVALVAGVLTAIHPDLEKLAEAEHPAPAVKPVAAPMQTAFVKPMNATVADGSVMHPAPDCPAPDRGFNPLYAKSAHRHMPGHPLRSGCVLHSLAERESNQRPDARSPVGAAGMMKFMAPTAAELGIDPLVPEEAVEGAARYLAWLEDRFPHVAPEDRGKFKLAAYNWGVGNVRRTGCSTWDCLWPLLPTETRIYVAGVEVMARDGSWYREGPHG